MEKLRKLFLVPGLRQWQRSSLFSKHTTLGLLVGVLALIGTIYSLWGPASTTEKEKYVRTELKKIQSNVHDAHKVFRRHQLLPNFTSQDEALRTLEQMNDFGSEAEQVTNSASLHRLLKEYGNDYIKEEFGRRLNEVHDRSLELSRLVVTIVNSGGPRSAKEYQEWYSKYVAKLNELQAAYNSYHSFIINLAVKDFVV